MRKGFNALQHGLRAASILLPADDAEEFQHLRRDLFHTYRPRTRDEAACVEAMASHQWRIARCRRWQAVYDAQQDALLFGQASGPAGHVCATDPDRWFHKSMDCVLQETRLDRLMCRARDKLLLLQKLRRNNLIAGAVEAEPIYWPAGPPDGEVVSPPQGGGLGGNGAPSIPASTSRDGAIGKDNERAAFPPEPRPMLRAAAPSKRQNGSAPHGQSLGCPEFPFSIPAVGCGEGGGPAPDACGRR